jgi:hypothetical protein
MADSIGGEGKPHRPTRHRRDAISVGKGEVIPMAQRYGEVIVSQDPRSGMGFGSWGPSAPPAGRHERIMPPADPLSPASTAL